MNSNEDKPSLITLLNEKVQKYNAFNFIETDPIQLPHRFSKKEDIEIVAFLVSTIAWGNRTSIIRSGERIIDIMQQNPHHFILNYQPEQIQNLHFVHRTFNIFDLDFFFRSLQHIYLNEGLEKAFKPHPTIFGSQGRIIQFRKRFLETEHETRSQKHLSNPLKNSAAKRLNMFLRWMVRQDENGVDFGIWNTISPSELSVPLDVHTANVGRKLGLITRKQNDGKALEELMHQLREFDSKDPSKYDFALFGLGAFEKF
jgi:uncharacterized protein (TIGR02757 family)